MKVTVVTLLVLAASLAGCGEGAGEDSTSTEDPSPTATAGPSPTSTADPSPTSTGDSTPTPSPDPTPTGVEGKRIAAGGWHTCAVLDGGLKCWGYDSHGQLGDGGTNEAKSTPVNVVGLSSGVEAVAAGALYTCALLDTGALKCWGYDDDGVLGNGSTSADQSTPIDVTGLSGGVVAVAAGGRHACALLDTGALKCWGDDFGGKLGDGGAETDQNTPVNVVGLSSGVVAVAAGENHTCAVLGTGALKCWGRDYNGQLGDGGTNTSQSTPVDVVGLSSGVVGVAAGSDHTCAVLDSGAVKCWGEDYNGQLGDGGADTDQSTPVNVAGLSSGVTVVAGGDHTCALLDTGALKCWGLDFYGELGCDSCTGLDSIQRTPADVVGLSSGIVGVGTGLWNTCAFLGNGTLKCWGYDYWGQLGDGGTDTSQSTPVNVVGTY